MCYGDADLQVVRQLLGVAPGSVETRCLGHSAEAGLGCAREGQERVLLESPVKQWRAESL